MTHSLAFLIHTQTYFIADFIRGGAVIEEVDDVRVEDMNEDGAFAANVSRQV